MKQIKITTSKGTWVLCEMPNKIKDVSEWWDLLPEVSLDNFRKRIQLSKIEEKEAVDIMPFISFLGLSVYEDFTNKYSVYYTAIESLHSLLKSKGIYLYKNPAPLPNYDLCPFTEFEEFNPQLSYFQEQAEKTFYNPYIFKL